MRYQLDNGLTVVLEPQQSAPIVALQVWVKAGSADETPQEAGLAHLHEHMLFKGTERRGMGEIAREVESRGGEINAWTSFDQTVYHVVLASSFFREGLDILADAVRGSRFDSAELAREIEVVVEEIKRSQDLPSRRVSRAMFETAFQAHPYRWPVLGTEQSVRSFTREKVLAFYGRHYRPDNMVVVVVGDVEPELARAEIERQLGGDWNGARPAPPARPVEPKQEGPRIAIGRHTVKEAHFALAFHIPGIAAEDIAAIDALAVLLGQGEGSRLNLGLRIERSLVSDVYAYAYAPRDPGLLVTGATLDPEKLPEAIAALLRELRRLQRAPIDPAELAVTKAIVEADSVYGRETVQGVARKLGFYEAVAGGLEYEAAYYEKIARLEPEDIRRVATRYLDLQGLTFAGLFPEGCTLGEAEVRALIEQARAEDPPGRPLRPLETPPPPRPVAAAKAPRRAQSGIEIAQLASGARVLIKPERGVPLVALRAVYPGGLRFETEQNNGISQLYSRLMTRSTRNRDAAQLAREIDEMAGSLQGSAGRNSTGLRGEFLTKHFDRAMRLFAECINEPAFDHQELERERAVLLQDIRSREDNPTGAAFDLFARTLYTAHPYRLDVLGEEASVGRVAAGDLQALHAVALHPANLTLCIVGDVDVERAFGLAEELFGGAKGARPAAPAVPQEPPLTAPRRVFRELDRAQAHLVYGFHGMTVASPERHALDVLSSVLSGQGGRLFLELRDKRALAYSVSCFSVEGIDPGYFGVYIGTSPEKSAQALQGIREQLQRLCDEPIAEAEVERARRYLIGAHAIGLQKNSARAALIAYDDAYGVGADAYLRYEEQIGAVTPERVREVARRLIVPSRGALAILGPRAADVDFPAG